MPGGAAKGYGYVTRDDAQQQPIAQVPSRVAAPKRLEARAIQDGAQRALVALNPDGSLVNPPSVGDGTVTVASFAAGIRPVEIVDALPAAGTQGRVVFLTTDNTLYRDTGSAWTAVVDASSLTGQITSTQITDGAITTPKLAANSVTSNELAANSVIAGKIAAAAVSTTELAANAVAAGKIAAGAVDTNALAALAVTAAKINVASLSAIAADVGTLTSGLIQNAGATRGIRLGTAALPGAWASYLDLDPASDDAYIARLADSKFLLTRGGALTLDGSVTVDAMGALDVLGSATFDGDINARGSAQFAEPGALMNESGTKRVSFDSSGSMVLRVQQGGAEGVKAVVGDYTRAGATPTDETENSWAPTDVSVDATSLFRWQAAPSGVSITLTPANLPAYDGNARIKGKLRASSAGGSAAGEIDARLRCKVNGADLGIIATCSATGSSGDVTVTFAATVTIGTGTAVTIELIPEVYNRANPGDTPAGFAEVNETDASWRDVTWKKTVGTTFARRGLFVGAEAGQPHASFEPLAAPLAVGDAVEGELWYDGSSHAFQYHDGTSVRTITAS